MSKRGKKSTAEALQLVERPFIDDERVAAAAELTDRWAHRVQASSGAVHDVQQKLQQLANALQHYERERRGAEIQAVYLAALNIQGLLEYRLSRESSGEMSEPPARGRGASISNARKSSSRPPSNSARRPGSGTKGQNTAKGDADVDDAVANLLNAASAAGSDPKRKQRCTSVLQQYFKAPREAPPAADLAVEAPNTTSSDAAAVPSASGTGSSARGQKETLPARPASASMGSIQALPLPESTPLAAASAGSGAVAGSLLRRPREVPAVLWEEMTLLRHAYYTANEKVTVLASAVTEQLQRFALVRNKNEVACYAIEAVQATLAKAAFDASSAALARQEAEAASALAESKAHSASAGSRKAKKG